MVKNKKIAWLWSLILIASLSAFGNALPGIFSAENFKALQNDPTALFSKTNECRLKKLLPPKDYKLYNEAMSQIANYDDVPNYISLGGNVKGLFTIFEGFFRMSTDGKIWIVYLFDDKVHYFTNDAATLNAPPKIIEDWSSRFSTAQWIRQLITVTPDNCK